MSQPTVSMDDFLNPRELQKRSGEIEAAFQRGITLRGFLAINTAKLESKFQFAHEQFAEEDHSTGKDIFRYLVAIDPYDVRYWLGLGCTWLALGQVGKALEVAMAAYFVEPTNPDTLTLAACAYLRASAKASAERCMEEARSHKGERDLPYVDTVSTLVASGGGDLELREREIDSVAEQLMRFLKEQPAAKGVATQEQQVSKGNAIRAVVQGELPDGMPVEFHGFQQRLRGEFAGSVIAFALQFLE